MSKTFEEVQEVVLKNQFTTKSLPVKDIIYLRDNMISIKNTPIQLSKVMNKKLLASLGVRTDIISKLNQIAPEMTAHYIAKARASKSIQNIHAIFDGNNQIVSFGDSEQNIMPGNIFMDILSRMMNDNPHMDISNISHNDKGVSLNLLDSRSEIDLFHNNGGEKGKEVFQFGSTLSTGINQPMQFSQFASRLWCTNGNTTQIDHKTFYIGQVNPETIHKFMSKYSAFEKSGYGRNFFEGHMQEATATRASIKEVLSVYTQIENKLGDATAAEMLPIGHIYRDYARNGVDVLKLNSKQQATAPTNYTVWEAFNALTDAASNFGDHDMTMQMNAGILLTGEKDMVNVVNVNPY